MKRALALAAALAVASPALAAQAFAVSVEDLTRSSDLVVRGKVLSTSADWIEGRIFTLAEVEVSATLRGNAPVRVVVATPGGIVGDVGQRVDGAAALLPGEDVVLFLRRPAAGAHRVTGMAQGKFTVEGRTARPDLSRLDFVGTALRAGERRSEAMPVEELEARIRSAR